jgi:hypothetical protein
MCENNRLEYLNKNFQSIYEDWWYPQVELCNIAARTFETRCRCHPKIVYDIMFNDTILNLDQSYSYNQPKKNFLNIPENRDPVDWMIDRLQDIYEDTMFGHQCLQDVSNIHALFWRKLSTVERQEIRDFIAEEPDITETGDVVFIWRGGWKDFSLIMCAVYQKSFDHIEIN